MSERTKRFIYLVAGVVYLSSMPTSVAKADTLVDPMRPANAPRSVAGPARAAAAPAAARLTAVFINDERRVAVVDGRVVKEGDRVSDGVIAHITADSVRIKRGEHTHTLKISTSAMPIRVRIAAESEP